MSNPQKQPLDQKQPESKLIIKKTLLGYYDAEQLTQLRMDLSSFIITINAQTVDSQGRPIISQLPFSVSTTQFNNQPQAKSNLFAQIKLNNPEHRHFLMAALRGSMSSFQRFVREILDAKNTNDGLTKGYMDLFCEPEYVDDFYNNCEDLFNSMLESAEGKEIFIRKKDMMYIYTDLLRLNGEYVITKQEKRHAKVDISSGKKEFFLEDLRGRTPKTKFYAAFYWRKFGFGYKSSIRGNKNPEHFQALVKDLDSAGIAAILATANFRDKDQRENFLKWVKEYQLINQLNPHGGIFACDKENFGWYPLSLRLQEIFQNPTFSEEFFAQYYQEPVTKIDPVDMVIIKAYYPHTLAQLSKDRALAWQGRKTITDNFTDLTLQVLDEKNKGAMDKICKRVIYRFEDQDSHPSHREAKTHWHFELLGQKKVHLSEGGVEYQIVKSSLIHKVADYIIGDSGDDQEDLINRIFKADEKEQKRVPNPHASTSAFPSPSTLPTPKLAQEFFNSLDSDRKEAFFKTPVWRQYLIKHPGLLESYLDSQTSLYLLEQACDTQSQESSPSVSGVESKEATMLSDLKKMLTSNLQIQEKIWQFVNGMEDRNFNSVINQVEKILVLKSRYRRLLNLLTQAELYIIDFNKIYGFDQAEWSLLTQHIINDEDVHGNFELVRKAAFNFLVESGNSNNSSDNFEKLATKIITLTKLRPYVDRELQRCLNKLIARQPGKTTVSFFDVMPSSFPFGLSSLSTPSKSSAPSSHRVSTPSSSSLSSLSSLSSSSSSSSSSASGSAPASLSSPSRKKEYSLQLSQVAYEKEITFIRALLSQLEIGSIYFGQIIAHFAGADSIIKLGCFAEIFGFNEPTLPDVTKKFINPVTENSRELRKQALQFFINHDKASNNGFKNLADFIEKQLNDQIKSSDQFKNDLALILGTNKILLNQINFTSHSNLSQRLSVSSLSSSSSALVSTSSSSTSQPMSSSMFASGFPSSFSASSLPAAPISSSSLLSSVGPSSSPLSSSSILVTSSTSSSLSSATSSSSPSSSSTTSATAPSSSSAASSSSTAGSSSSTTSSSPSVRTGKK